jgi:hypothetical protein
MVSEIDSIMNKICDDRHDGRIYQMWRAWMVMPQPRLQFHEIISREFNLTLSEAYILVEHLFRSQKDN